MDAHWSHLMEATLVGAQCSVFWMEMGRTPKIYN